MPNCLRLLVVLAMTWSLAACAAQPAARVAEDPIQKEATVRNLIQVTDLMAEMKTLLDQLIKKPVAASFQERLQLNDVDAMLVANAFVETMWEDLSPSLLEGQVKLYSSIFTDQELRELYVFYTTPVGRKVVENQRRIYLQSFQMGEQAQQTWRTKMHDRNYTQQFYHRMENRLPEGLRKRLKEKGANP